jgi:Sulfotransferase domain
LDFSKKLKLERPHFFIVGAPKCGTTSLNNYLSQHPNVFMAQKELHRFGRDLQMKIVPSEEEYSAAFKGAPRGSLTGEASVWYLFSKTAAEEIKKFSPDAKIIIMLRNPVDVLQSLHSQNLYNGNENVRDFKEALALDEERKKGKSLPPSLDFFELPSYIDTGLFFSQVKKYFDVFGKQNVHVILYDDFVNNTRQVFHETLQFLNLGSAPDIQFKVANPNKNIKFQGMHDIIKRPPVNLKKIVRTILPIKKARHALMLVLLKINTQEKKREKIPDDLRKELSSFYKEDITKLGVLIDSDLSAWTS